MKFSFTKKNIIIIITIIVVIILAITLPLVLIKSNKPTNTILFNDIITTKSDEFKTTAAYQLNYTQLYNIRIPSNDATSKLFTIQKCVINCNITFKKTNTNNTKLYYGWLINGWGPIKKQLYLDNFIQIFDSTPITKITIPEFKSSLFNNDDKISIGFYLDNSGDLSCKIFEGQQVHTTLTLTYT